MYVTKDELVNAFTEAVNTIEVGLVWDDNYSIKVPGIKNKKEVIDIFIKKLGTDDINDEEKHRRKEYEED